MNYQDYITIEPDKRGGKPCIRGLRITVYDVLDYMASDMTQEEILEDFPDLTPEDLKACLAFKQNDANAHNLRPVGLCAGKFVAPADFDAPLPDTTMADFEGA